MAMAQVSRMPDAWTRARDRFIQDLSEDEKYLYFQATAESILLEASTLENANKVRSSCKSCHSFVSPAVF